MKKLENCIVENCIPTPSSCVEWNGGTIEFLGICNGDSLNDLMWEIIAKLKELAGEDISSFDIDAIVEICNNMAPQEVTLISILNVMKDAQICLKEYLDNLTEVVAEINTSQNVSVNLKCYADLDNLGNILSITREALDQLIIDNLCNHKLRLETIEGKLITLQSQVDNIDFNAVVDELSFPTCLNPAILPNSEQTIATAAELCDLELALGDSSDIGAALSHTAPDVNAEFGAILGWNMTPSNLAESYGNLLIEVEALRQRIIFIEENCCAITCADVEIGFSAVFTDSDTLTIRFTAGAGTNIPTGWTDGGSSVTITDGSGDTLTENITIANNSEHDISILGLSQSADLQVTVTAIMTNGSLVCERCVTKTISTTGACDFCQICVTGSTGVVVILYEDGSKFVGTSFNPSTTTTTTGP